MSGIFEKILGVTVYTLCGIVIALFWGGLLVGAISLGYVVFEAVK